MNRGNCRKTTPIPKKEWCVINNENNKIIAGYIHKSSAQKKSDQNNLVDSLVGAIPNSEKSLDEYRSERLKKYASTD